MLVAGAIVLASAAGCRRSEVGDDRADTVRVMGERIVLPSGSPQLAALQTAAVSSIAVDSLEVPGRLTWDEDATVRVFAPYAGRIASLAADVGMRVRAGDVLARITSADFGQAQADARRAATDLGQAQRTAIRTHDLFAHGVVARKDVETADADLVRAQTESDRAHARVAPLISDSTAVDGLLALRAPLAGIIVDRNVTPGQEVRPDQMLANAPQLVAPLFTVSDPSRVWVLLDIAERDAPHVRPGMAVTLSTTSVIGRQFSGRVNWVSASLDPVTHTVRARGTVDRPDGLLRPEMLVTVRVAVQVASRMTVPASAVLFSNGQHIVFVDEGAGKLRRCLVTVEPAPRGALGLEGALEPGARVVTSDVLLLEQLFQTALHS
jgi:cobalt-zinc-cadmium efflux system membrane fusion protein